MSHRLRLAFLPVLILSLALPAAASAAAPKPLQGSAIVFQRGFDVMYWDSVNGLRRVDRGDEPSISSNGRYVTYQRRGGAGCGKVIVRDLRTNRELSLPGIETGSCIEDPHLSGDGHYVAFSSDGKAAGDPSAIYLYDTVAKRMLNLPAPVQSGSFEDSPSLSDDGRLMAFVSGRNTLNFDDVFVADLSRLASTGTVSLLPTPGAGHGRCSVRPGDVGQRLAHRLRNRAHARARRAALQPQRGPHALRPGALRGLRHL